jgi:hypothetical protein
MPISPHTHVWDLCANRSRKVKNDIVEVLSLTGHVVESDCKTKSVLVCTAD